MRKVKLTKLEELPDALHPNNIPVNHVFIGDWVAEPALGKRFELWPISHTERGVSTSAVTEIDGNTFKTLSSVYKWEEC